MLGEIGFVVAAGIQMKFVGDAARSEQLVKCLRAGVESVVIFGAAIEIDVHADRARAIADNREWAIALPEGGIEWIAERSAQREGDRGFLRAGHLDVRQVGDQRGAVRADRAEHLRISKREPQRAIASHRDAGDAAVRAVGADAIVAFDEGQEFLDEKILVAHAAVA